MKERVGNVLTSTNLETLSLEAGSHHFEEFL